MFSRNLGRAARAQNSGDREVWWCADHRGDGAVEATGTDGVLSK